MTRRAGAILLATALALSHRVIAAETDAAL